MQCSVQWLLMRDMPCLHILLTFHHFSVTELTLSVHFVQLCEEQARNPRGHK